MRQNLGMANRERKDFLFYAMFPMTCRGFHILLTYVISAIIEENIRFRRDDSLCNSNAFFHNGGNHGLLCYHADIVFELVEILGPLIQEFAYAKRKFLLYQPCYTDSLETKNLDISARILQGNEMNFECQTNEKEITYHSWIWVTSE